MNPKMQTLDAIIGMMDDRMLGAAKARKQASAPAAPMAAAPEAGGTSPAELAESQQAPAESDDDSDRQLMELYDQDEFKPATSATQILGSN